MNKRHLTVCALLASALVLTACGSGDDTATTGAGTGAANSNTAPADSQQGNDADISFLTAMKPHHEQAIEMSDIVLAANPPSEVAALAEQIKGAQAPEIEQMNTMLADLGQPAGGMSHGGGHMAGGHGGMMSDADMAALEAATGTDAARLYLEGMIAHHQGAIEASEAELADGEYEPARALATSIAKEQAAEIATMQDLLASL
jgi:uncharacterized protein (DUF305 family)